ncbi:MAG: leucine-rich repeat domain-containing protein [Treponema sp.]|nr:leucine-rich repeat domain-containing protein [Treponema sp.]
MKKKPLVALFVVFALIVGFVGCDNEWGDDMEVKRGDDGVYTLVKYNGTDTHVTVPSRIDIIADRAFENNQNIEEVTIKDGVKQIGWWAFSGCTNLKTVTIPKSVTDIEQYAFYNSGLKTVYYKGSESDWNNVYKFAAFWGTNEKVYYNQ